MNETQRVFVFTRYYWPTTNDQTLRLRRQVGQLSAAGFSPEVVSARWHRTWPQHVNCEETPVHRIDNAPSSHLKQSRYSRTLVEWLTKNVEATDLIYCDSIDLEAYSIVSNYCKPSTLSRLSREAKPRPKIVVRFDPSELSTKRSSEWQMTERNAEVCRLADCVAVPSAVAHQQLVATGISPQNVVRILDPVGKSIERSSYTKEGARRILAAINHDLFARKIDRVIVCPGDLSKEWNIDLVIRALAPLVEENRTLRLWLLGDSDDRSRYYDQLQHHGIHRLVAMPGMFTDLEMVFQAADLVLLPAADKGLTRALLPTCIASAIPLMAVRTAETTALLRNHTDTLSITQCEPTDIRDWVSEWVRDPLPSQRAVSDLRVKFHNMFRSVPPTRNGSTDVQSNAPSTSRFQNTTRNQAGGAASSNAHVSANSLAECLLRLRESKNMRTGTDRTTV